MDYYDNMEEYAKRGIDYDLGGCLEYNPQQTFTIEDIDKVVAVAEGVNDEKDWHWVFKLKTPVNKMRYVYLRGGCDYTGWDCRSWASHVFAKTALKAAHVLKEGGVPVDANNTPVNAGMGHMLNILSGTYTDQDQQDYEKLVQQIKSAKSKTWREKNDKGVPPIEELPTQK